jgi:hypothetical protein
VNSIDAVRQAQARLTELLDVHGADLPVRIVTLLSSAADHLLESTALPDRPGSRDRALNPRSEIADIDATLRHALPLMGDRAAIAIGFALRDLAAVEALWRRS